MRSDGGQTLRPRRVMGSCDVSLWARQDSNLQPTDYESAALTRLSYGPQLAEYMNGNWLVSIHLGLERAGPTTCHSSVEVEDGRRTEHGNRCSAGDTRVRM